jgi:hypothetical protein
MFSRRIRAAGSLEVICIAPAAPLGTLTESVRWNRGKVERWAAQGARDARRAIQSAAAGRDFLRCVLQ